MEQASIRTRLINSRYLCQDSRDQCPSSTAMEGLIFIRIASWGIYSFNHILSVIIHVLMWLSGRRASKFSGNHLYNYQCSWFPDYVFLRVYIVLYDLLSVGHKVATSATLQHIFILTNANCSTLLRSKRHYGFTKTILTKRTWSTFIHVIRVYPIRYDRDFVVLGFGFVIS